MKTHTSHLDYLPQNWLGLIILTALATVALSGCSGLSDVRPLADTRKAPKPITIPERKPVKRELGSLWSEDSEWNDIYSETPNRVPGDTILVRLTPRFRMQLMRRLKREFPIQVKTKVEDVEKGKPKPKVEVAVTSDQIADDDTQQVYVTVVEVLPRFTYRVKAQETLRVGGREPIVTLEAELRNRDIQMDESATSDALMNMAFELKPQGGDREIASDKSQDDA